MASSTAIIDLITVGQAGKEVTANDLFFSLSPSLLFARRAASSVGLTWAYYGGRYNGVDVANGAVTLTTNATNYVEADVTTGAVAANTAGFTAGTSKASLYSVVVSAAGLVTSYKDFRQSVASGGGALPYGIGGGTQTFAAGNNYSLVCGGNTNNMGAGTACVIVGGTNHTINGSANNGFIGGGLSNTVGAAGMYASVLGGYSNTANGRGATVPGGEMCTADAGYSSASGCRATVRGIHGAFVFGANTLTGTVGGTQWANYMLAAATADATPKALTTDGSVTANALNQAALPTGGATYAVVGNVVARNTATGDSAMWEIKALVKYVGTTLSIVGTPTVTQLFADTAAASWAVSATANATARALVLTATGAAATNIRWLAKIETVELMNA